MDGGEEKVSPLLNVMFQILFSSHGESAFGALPQKIQQRVTEEFARLAHDTLWFRRVRKLGGSEDRYRLRIGRWRVLFWLRGDIIEIADIFLKKERGDYRRRG